MKVLDVYSDMRFKSPEVFEWILEVGNDRVIRLSSNLL